MIYNKTQMDDLYITSNYLDECVSTSVTYLKCNERYSIDELAQNRDCLYEQLHNKTLTA